MSSLGETFRKQREARGVSLEDVAQESKISIRFLRAIERERFDQLPGGIFNRSFVRQYARLLGMDEEVAVRDYMQAIGQGMESLASSAPPEPEVPMSSGGGYLRIILVAIGLGLFLGALGYGVYYFKEHFVTYWNSLRGGNRETATLASPPASTPDQPSPSEPSTQAGGSPESAAGPAPPGVGAETGPQAASSPSPSSASTSAAAPAAGDALQLRIDSQAPVWVSITVDGKKQYQGTLAANQNRQVQAAESVQLTVGDAAAVALTLNGKPLPSLGRSGEVKTLTITAQDTATPPSP